jgi:hypothetical protein
MKRTIGCLPRAILSVISVEKGAARNPLRSTRVIRSDARKDGSWSVLYTCGLFVCVIATWALPSEPCSRGSPVKQADVPRERRNGTAFCLCGMPDQSRPDPQGSKQPLRNTVTEEMCFQPYRVLGMMISSKNVTDVLSKLSRFYHPRLQVLSPHRSVCRISAVCI